MEGECQLAFPWVVLRKEQKIYPFLTSGHKEVERLQIGMIFQRNNKQFSYSFVHLKEVVHIGSACCSD